MRRFLVLVLFVGTVVVVRPEPSGACTCLPFDATQALASSEGAFVARLTIRREDPTAPAAPDGTRHNQFVYGFQVDEVVKGTFPSEVEVLSGEGGGDCGVETPIGEPVGLLIDRWQGQPTSSLCAQVEPHRLRQATAPVPAPDGQPPVRLLVGTSYGGGRVLSLDAHGRVVSFGGGQGETTVVAVCPGSERMVEVFVPPEEAIPLVPVLAVRRIDGLAVEREVPLPGLGSADGVYREVEALTCRDSAAQDIVLFVREESPNYHSRVVQLRGTDRTTLWEGTATHGAFHAGGRLAYVTSGRRGTDLLAVDLTAEPAAERRVAAIPDDPWALAVNPDGRVAMPAGGTMAPATAQLVLVTVDPSTGKVLTATVPGESPSGAVVWASDGRLVFLPDEARDMVRVYDRDLTELAAWRGWESSRGWTTSPTRILALVVADRLLGLAQGLVQSAPIDGGPVLRFTELGDGLPGTIAAVTGAGDGGLALGAAPSPPQLYGAEHDPDHSSGATIAALVAVLVAGAALAMYSSSRRRPETNVS